MAALFFLQYFIREVHHILLAERPKISYAAMKTTADGLQKMKEDIHVFEERMKTKPYNELEWHQLAKLKESYNRVASQYNWDIRDMDHEPDPKKGEHPLPLEFEEYLE